VLDNYACENATVCINKINKLKRLRLVTDVRRINVVLPSSDLGRPPWTSTYILHSISDTRVFPAGTNEQLSGGTRTVVCTRNESAVFGWCSADERAADAHKHFRAKVALRGTFAASNFCASESSPADPLLQFLCNELMLAASGRNK